MLNIALQIIVAEYHQLHTAVFRDYEIGVLCFAFCHCGVILVRCRDGDCFKIITADIGKVNTLCVYFFFFALCAYDSTLNGAELQLRYHNCLAVYEDRALCIRRARCQMNDG